MRCNSPKLIRDKVHHCYVEVPCRVCMACRLNYTKEWAIRVCNEASCHGDNCFVTLTYDDKFLPSDMSLHKEELQKFFKRLRKHLVDKKIRYFACGEYGSDDNTHRPHFHANIFGWWPQDAYFWKMSEGNPLYRSPTLEKLWPFGYSTVGQVTFKSARYVASYIVKQHRGDDKDYYKKNGINPEFVVMSNGIGRQFVDDNIEQLKGLGHIVFNGYKSVLPRYYENRIYKTDEEKENRKNVKQKYIEKSRQRFEDSLDFNLYRNYRDSLQKAFKNIVGLPVYTWKQFVEDRTDKSRQVREERLKQKIERKQNDR